jgi:hypothetical protein
LNEGEVMMLAKRMQAWVAFHRLNLHVSLGNHSPLPLFQGRPAAGKLENRGDEFKAVAIIQRFAQTDLVEQASACLVLNFANDAKIQMQTGRTGCGKMAFTGLRG